MKTAAAAIFLTLGVSIYADPPSYSDLPSFMDRPSFAEQLSPEFSESDPLLDEQQFMREYIWGVHRHRIPGGRLYGWKINDRLTFGRFKGENDDFGFGYELNKSDRLEFTNEGIRWRRAIGGPSNR
jgi:hypothetical protein